MNWLWLVIGIVAGALGQRWLGRRQQIQSRLAETSMRQPPAGNGGIAANETADALDEGLGGQSVEAPVGSDYARDLEKEAPELASQGENERKLLWMAYVRALERAQFQGGFLARVAHELRSPLSSLMGLQQLILADLCDDPEEERQCVAQSYEAAQNLHSLMDQLIRVSKLEQGSQRLDIQPIALDVLLEDVESFVQLQVADRNARLQLQLPAQSVYGSADYNSLRQILVMLVEAALSQKACEMKLSLVNDSAGVRINFWADQPLVPLAELKGQLQQNELGAWTQEALGQLKQSLGQQPGASFTPHRLSAGMALLVSQLLLDLNGGRLDLVPVVSELVPQAAEDGAGASIAGAKGDLGQTYALELWLPES